MAHGALGAAHLAAAQVGLRAAGREGPGRWAKPTHRLPLVGNARILFNIRCSSCLVLPVVFSPQTQDRAWAVSPLFGEEEMEGQAAWLPCLLVHPH